MKNWRIVPATEQQMFLLAPRLRAEDCREVWASHRQLPLEALLVSLRSSPLAWTCLLEDEPAFSWGVAGKLGENTGRPWLLASPDLLRVRRDFLLLSRKYVELMQQRFPLLENYVHGANLLSRRWLAWCGFKEEAHPSLLHGEIFYRFWRQHVQC